MYYTLTPMEMRGGVNGWRRRLPAGRWGNGTNRGALSEKISVVKWSIGEKKAQKKNI
jgi:hypothetical protein